MSSSGSHRFRRLVVCLALASPLAAAAQNAGITPGPAFTFNPPPCQGNVFLDVNCSGQFDAWIEQYARDAITGGCGGGNYCPNNPVTRGQMAVFVEKAMRGSTTWPPNTVLVHAVLASDGSIDTVASGQALLDAVAAIPTSGPGAPSAGRPWRIQVGPGRFDLGNDEVLLPNYVVLEGSGYAAPPFGNPLTTVTAVGSNAFTGTIVAAPSLSEVRDIAVESSGGGTRAIAISNNGGGLILDRVLGLAAGADSSYGLYSLAGEIHISESSLAASGNGVNSAVALYAEATTVGIERSTARAAGSTNANGAYGMYLVGGTLELTDSRIESSVSADTPIYGVRLSGGASGRLLRSQIRIFCNGSAFAYGVYPQAPLSPGLLVRHSQIQASGSGCEADAILAFDANVTIEDSSLEASSNTSGTALKTTAATSSPNVRVHRSSLVGAGSGAAIDNTAGFTTRVGGSYLFGSVANAGTLSCVLSYGGFFTELNAACQ